MHIMSSLRSPALSAAKSKMISPCRDHYRELQHHDDDFPRLTNMKVEAPLELVMELRTKSIRGAHILYTKPPPAPTMVGLYGAVASVAVWHFRPDRIC